MGDVYSKVVRSYVMSRVKSKNTKPELLVRLYLFSKGLRYRLHKKDLPGKPDIVLAKYKTVIFINGCFWHGHENCQFFKIPQTNTNFWKDKIARNVDRESRNVKSLQERGWKVIIVWGCELKPKYLKNTLGSVLQKILN